MKKGLVSGLVPTLAVALVLGLAACSRDEPPNLTTVSVTTPTTVGHASTTLGSTSTTVGSTSTTAETTSTLIVTPTTTFPQEPMTIRYATTFARGGASGRVVQRFIDHVEEATAGTITFDVFFDGSLGNATEELALVRSGTADMVSLRFSAFPDQLPLLCLPCSKPGERQRVVDCLDHIAFENPDTTPLIQAEAKANNLVYVGFVAGGANVFVSRGPLALLSDLGGAQFGAGASTPALESLGVEVVDTSTAGMQEALAEGVVEVARTGFSTAMDLGWYQSAKHYAWDGTYAAGSAFSVNLGTWGRLSPEAQEVFYEAARDAEAFSRQLNAAEITASTGVLEEAGVIVGALSPEDQAAWSLLLFEEGAAECMARAVSLGIVSDMLTVLSTAAAFTGTAWKPPAE